MLSNKQYTIKDLVDWIIANRRAKAFVDWTPESIAIALKQAIEENCLSVVYDCSGKFCGVAHGFLFNKDKVFFVTNVLTTKPGALQFMLGHFKKVYPDYELEADRRGKRVCYNTKQLLKHMLS